MTGQVITGVCDKCGTITELTDTGLQWWCKDCIDDAWESMESMCDRLPPLAIGCSGEMCTGEGEG